MIREAVLLDENRRPVMFQGRPMSVPVALPRITKSAHVSGNQIDVFHCPFCGSGAIVSRSDASIECSFCNSAFTVTVSPMYPAFPMSVGGQPYPWPGRPDGGMDPAMMGDPNAADSDGYGGQLIPGGGAGAAADDPDGDGDDDGGNPFAKSGDGADDSGASSSDGDGPDDKEAEVGGKKKPPFGKKKSSVTTFTHQGQTVAFLEQAVVPLYRTVTGAQVPRQEFMRHLAIATAHDPNAMAARVKQERRG